MQHPLLRFSKSLPITRVAARPSALPILAMLSLTLGLQQTAEAKPPDMLFQAMIGAIDGDAIHIDPKEDITELAQERDSIPWFGITAQANYADPDAMLEYGLETGGFLNFNLQVDSAYFNENGARVRLSSDYVFFEFYGAGYLAAKLGSRVRLHAATGPSLLYGHFSVNNVETDNPTPKEETPNSDSDFGTGWQTNVGIDFRLDDKTYLGVAARYVKASLDFDDTLGKVELDGPQYFGVISFRY